MWYEDWMYRIKDFLSLISSSTRKSLQEMSAYEKVNEKHLIRNQLGCLNYDVTYGLTHKIQYCPQIRACLIDYWPATNYSVGRSWTHSIDTEWPQG